MVVTVWTVQSRFVSGTMALIADIADWSEIESDRFVLEE